MQTNSFQLLARVRHILLLHTPASACPAWMDGWRADMDGLATHASSGLSSGKAGPTRGRCKGCRRRTEHAATQTCESADDAACLQCLEPSPNSSSRDRVSGDDVPRRWTGRMRGVGGANRQPEAKPDVVRRGGIDQASECCSCMVWVCVSKDQSFFFADDGKLVKAGPEQAKKPEE